LAIVVGIAALVLSDATRLTAEKLLSGGRYLKSPWPDALQYAGIVLIVLGLLVVIVALIPTVDNGARVVLVIVVLVAAVVTLVGGGLLLTGYELRNDDRGAQVPPQQPSPASSEATSQPPNTSSADPSGTSASDAPANVANCDAADRDDCTLITRRGANVDTPIDPPTNGGFDPQLDCYWSDRGLNSHGNVEVWICAGME